MTEMFDLSKMLRICNHYEMATDEGWEVRHGDVVPDITRALTKEFANIWQVGPIHDVSLWDNIVDPKITFKVRLSRPALEGSKYLNVVGAATIHHRILPVRMEGENEDRIKIITYIQVYWDLAKDV